METITLFLIILTLIQLFLLLIGVKFIVKFIDHTFVYVNSTVNVIQKPLLPHIHWVFPIALNFSLLSFELVMVQIGGDFKTK
jgi:hypothetical protein